MNPTVLTVGLAGTDFRMDIHYAGVEYFDERRAIDAWERVNHLQIPDAGATRSRDPRDPEGPGRYVVFLTFSREAWDQLEPNIRAGVEWQPHDGFVNYLIRKRLGQVAAGASAWSERGPR